VYPDPDVVDLILILPDGSFTSIEMSNVSSFVIPDDPNEVNYPYANMWGTEYFVSVNMSDYYDFNEKSANVGYFFSAPLTGGYNSILLDSGVASTDMYFSSDDDFFDKPFEIYVQGIDKEKPQIVVPMLDIYVSAPSIEAPEVARLVTQPLEKLLAQLRGVEHIYSTTQSNGTVVTLRFTVGHDREQAILDTYAKLYSYQHTMASVISSWQVRPVEVNDVPIVMLGLFSKDPKLYNDYELTRFANEIANSLQRIENTSEVKVIAGRKRTLTVNLDATALAAHQTTLSDVYYALSDSNQLFQVGSVVNAEQQIMLQAGDVLRTKAAIEQLVVNVINGKSVYLKDIAKVLDGPSEPENYQWLAQSDTTQEHPLVTLSVAKKAGTNAVAVANDVHAMMADLKTNFLPSQIDYTILRDYGQTA
ncbi:hypothetical protein LCGC14_2765910, partial [marine sediment metagenome]